ncbi:GNAT family N-acetyltransferase [Kitasatospora aureofaciens]|uniref:GNAT family N-acetyltransferase n=1 Tax=Kitasatospora aureofaciens TaxID=1894 RepID=UPI0037C50B37
MNDPVTTMTGVRALALPEAAAREDWSRLCGPADLFCTPAWLGVELGRRGPWVPADSACLVHTDEAGRITAGLTLQQFDRRVEDVTVRVDKMLLALPDHAGRNEDGLADALMPSLMCGGWFNSRVLTADPSAAPADPAVLRALVARAVATGRRQGSACAFFPYVNAEETALRSALEEAGFIRFPALARHVLDCDYPSHADYLASLPSRRRVRIRAELRKFEQAGAVTSHQPLDGSNVERIAHLAWLLEHRYDQMTTSEQLTPWFAAIAEHIPTTVFTARLDGRDFAMSMWLHHQGRMYGFHAGFDYELGAGLPMYSVLGYHLPIAYGCDDPDVTVLEYGISTDEAKLLRGTRAMPQYLYLKPLTERAAQAAVAPHPCD